MNRQQLLVLFITVALIGLLVWLAPRGGRSLEPELFCRAQYSQAKTAADTALADNKAAASVRGGRGSCGDLRRSGRLSRAV